MSDLDARARLAMSDPTPRRLCPCCQFVAIRITSDWCRDCQGGRHEALRPCRSHADSRSGPRGLWVLWRERERQRAFLTLRVPRDVYMLEPEAMSWSG